MREYPKETDEFVPLKAYKRIGGVRQPVDTFDYCVVKTYEDPTGWTAATVVDGDPCFRIDGPVLGRGTYKVYVKITSLPETPVVLVGDFRLK